MTKKEILECMTARDCKELKELIMQNPDLPLLVFCSSECLGEEYAYYSMVLRSAEVKEITLYETNGYDNVWLDRAEYAERLENDMTSDDTYFNLSDDAFNAVLKERIANTPFVKAIVVHVGD